MERSEVAYARSGDYHLAYQTVGEGSVDLLYLWGGFLSISVVWEYPPFAAVLEHMASFSRLILTDRRGVGLSDPVPVDAAGTTPEIARDLRAVLDAVASERAVVLAESFSGGPAIELAARYPDRVSKVILFNAFAKTLRGDGYPYGRTREESESLIDAILHGPADEGLPEDILPSSQADPELRAWLQRAGRIGASPRTAEAIYGVFQELDVRDRLAEVTQPVLVIHRRDNHLFGLEHGRYLADHIPDANLLDVEGGDQTLWAGEVDTVLGEIEQFATGERHLPAPERVLATLLFTDIAGSTEQAVRLGDHRWRQVLDQHDAVVVEELERHGGQMVNAAGDGILARFDAPGRAIACAVEIRRRLARFDLVIRASVHTGEVELREDDLSGLAVNLAARVMHAAAPGQVLVSGAVPPLMVGSEVCFEHAGRHEFRGVPGSWDVYSVCA